MIGTSPGNPATASAAQEPALWDICWTPAAASAAELVVTGELDGATAPLLRCAWDAQVAALLGPVHVDLARVSFCNAAGLHVLAAILASCGDHGLAVRLSVQPRLAWLVRLVGLPVDGRAELVVVPRSGRRPGGRP